MTAHPIPASNGWRAVRHMAYRDLRMDPRTPTASYSSIHAALAATAEHHGIAPTDVRVLLAIHDLGGRATTEQITHALMTHDSAVRRALVALYALKMADSRTRGRRGVPHDAFLRARGRAVVATFGRFLTELHTHPDEPDELVVQASATIERLDVPTGAPA
jgi:DNA-binding transcriptional ArsR family regulator